MPPIKGSYSIKKTSILDPIKDQDGLPIKVNSPQFLSFLNFSSMSEKDRYIKNMKILNEVEAEYLRNPNHFEVSS